MTIKAYKHLLTGDELNAGELLHLLQRAADMKANPLQYAEVLAGKHVALVFEKPSLRTRFSFTAAVQQLGGQVIESQSNSRKAELPQDFIRVVQGYCSAMMIRTFHDADLSLMKQYATIPIINGLTDTFHPCQTLADLLTLTERFQTLEGLTVCYIGDGNNVLHSLCLMATKLGIRVQYCCPKGHGPSNKVQAMLEKNGTASMVQSFVAPQNAVKGSHAVYTDVWTSMGFEGKDESLFQNLQVNEALMALAAENAVFMHCMPMNRGKEVSITLPDAPCSVIFQQSENRLHAQKALLDYVL